MLKPWIMEADRNVTAIENCASFSRPKILTKIKCVALMSKRFGPQWLLFTIILTNAILTKSAAATVDARAQDDV